MVIDMIKEKITDFLKIGQQFKKDHLSDYICEPCETIESVDPNDSVDGDSKE
jgi:hypothetical protein